MAWQGNFRLFFVHILLILNTVFYTFIKQFSLEKIAEKFLEMTKVMPDEKIYLYLKFNYISDSTLKQQNFHQYLSFLDRQKSSLQEKDLLSF